MTKLNDLKLKIGIVIFATVVLTGTALHDVITLREVLEVRGSTKVADTRFASPPRAIQGPIVNLDTYHTIAMNNPARHHLFFKSSSTAPST